MSEVSAAAAFPPTSGSALAEVLTQQLKVLLEAGNYDGVKLLLQPVQEVDIAEAIGGLPRTLQALAFRLLPKDEAIEVYEYLDPSVQQTLLERLRSSEVLELVEEMSPDDRVTLFDELPAKVVRRLLAELSPAERRVTAQLLGYEPETAGRLMTTEFIDLKEFHSVAQALTIIRRRARDTETIYALYVTDASRHLTGILSLRDLVVAEPEERLGDVMTREVVSVGTDTDQEEVARVIQRYDFLAVPVVDREERLVGIVTVDDVIDVIQQEATRDLYAAGAVQAGDEDDYFQSNLFTIARRRVVWLLVLLLANSGTAAVIASQDAVLKQVVVLAAFIPLLIGTGGIQVAGGLLLDHIDDVVDGDDPHQPLLAVDHRHGQKVVALDHARHLFLIGIGADAHHLPGHHIAEPLLRIGRDQVAQRQHAGEVARGVGDVEGVDGLGVAGTAAHDLQGLGGAVKLLEVDELRRHQAARRFRLVPQHLRRDTPLGRAQLRQKAPHHLGGQLIEQAHPIVG